jgi:nucleotide-binding universal stress UspA family protein
MAMTGPVVCGVDISDSTRTVIDTARWLADRIGCRLIVVHAAEEPPAEAEEFALIISNRLDGGDSEVRLAEGSAIEALAQAVADEHADLLVVGSRGQRSLQPGLLGSVSRGVTARSAAPVVVVPPQISQAADAGTDQRSIVCGVDGSGHALAAVRVAGGLARQLGCRLLLVHALHDLKAGASYLGAPSTNPPLGGQSDARDRQAAQIVGEARDSLDGFAEGVVETGSPWGVLESVADRESSALIVVAARGRGAVRSALFGSVARRLASTSGRPVVLVPDLAEAA